MAGVLVRTGKFTERSLAKSGVHPDLVVDDVVALAEILRVVRDFAWKA